MSASGDTQTGLRAFDMSLVPLLLDIRGERYEYEMNMLLDFARMGVPIRETRIETVYIKGNSTSHFHVLRDSAMIYGEIFKFAASSFTGFVVDYSLYSLMVLLTAGAGRGQRAALQRHRPHSQRHREFHHQQKAGVQKRRLRPAHGSAVFCTGRLYSGRQHPAPELDGQRIGRQPLRRQDSHGAHVLHSQLAGAEIHNLQEARQKEARPLNETLFLLAEIFRSLRRRSGAVHRLRPAGRLCDTPHLLRIRKRRLGLDPEQHHDLVVLVVVSSGTAAVSKTGSAVSTDSSYSDDNISITLTTAVVDDTTVYVADVQVTSLEYLKTALAGAAYGKNITAVTSEIASDNSAILAINGDYYGGRSAGYVIRNGVLYRSASAGDDQEDLVIYSDGSFEIIKEGDVTAQELLDKGAVQVFSFGPGLVENGEVSVTEDEEVGRAKTSNPRTAIGEISPLHYVLVVADGRTSESAGLSLYQLAEYMKSLGVTTAYNLDGGGSSTMYFNGQVVNNPTTNGTTIKERKVSDIVYVGY
jgi:exopolysaccharide biosynthesis protein